MKGNTTPDASAKIVDIAVIIPNILPLALCPLTGFLLTLQSLSSNFCIAA